MNHGSITFRSRVLRLSFLSAVVAAVAFASAQTTAKPADDLPATSQIQPDELLLAMKTPGTQKPAVLYVGPKAFYAQGHILGADYIGPVGKPEGIATLRARVAQMRKDMPIVIYCGCCPWDHCPNIRPAFAELKKEGFSKVRVLYLATSFGVDWKDKGLPVTTGE
ncbi:MAG TPA: rhodanese-like domain-containing protein [Candidatus Angelobacter sp.]|nr:rhodanese-like domain-containing protein [Candidatus Angelobacter sp.]